MPRCSCMFAALCLFVASGCFVATSSVVAKHKSYHGLSASARKHKSTGRKEKHSAAKKSKSSVATNEEPVVIPELRTPVDTSDCIIQAQAFYVRARAISKQTKQSIPQEFEQVISKLDEFCGEEEFDKARISIDWMHTCLQNFSKESTALFCTKTAGYSCAIDPQSDACVTNAAQR